MEVAKKGSTRGRRVVSTASVSIPDHLGLTLGSDAAHLCRLESYSTTAVYVRMKGVSTRPEAAAFVDEDGTSLTDDWVQEVLLSRPTRRPLRSAPRAEEPPDGSKPLRRVPSDAPPRPVQILTHVDYRDGTHPVAGIYVGLEVLELMVPLA